MAFVKRHRAPPTAPTSKPDFSAIVARPKKGVAACGTIPSLFPETPPSEVLRGLATLSNDLPPSVFEDSLTVYDKVQLARAATDPSNKQERRYRNRLHNRATAITAMCVVCQGTRKGVRDCDNTMCPLWAFRFGGNPFHAANKRKWSNHGV